jgi:hypothetical protein
MRYGVGAIVVAALLTLSAPLAKAADADCKVTWDHGLVCTITILGKTITITTYAKASDEQKQRVLRTVEAWKKLPDNQRSLNYVTKEATKIKREIKDISVTRKMDTASPSLATSSKRQNGPAKPKTNLIGTKLTGSPSVNSLAGKSSTVLDTRSSAGTAVRKPDTLLRR